jgi:hypothetical protein
MFKYIAPLFLLVACGKDADPAKMGEVVDPRSGYSCVYSGKKNIGGMGRGLFAIPPKIADTYQCQNLKTGATCNTTVSEDKKTKRTSCDQFDWSILESL